MLCIILNCSALSFLTFYSFVMSMFICWGPIKLNCFFLQMIHLSSSYMWLPLWVRGRNKHVDCQYWGGYLVIGSWWIPRMVSVQYFLVGLLFVAKKDVRPSLLHNLLSQEVATFFARLWIKINGIALCRMFCLCCLSRWWYAELVFFRNCLEKRGAVCFAPADDWATTDLWQLASFLLLLFTLINFTC